MALFCAEKLLEMGAIPVSLSDSGGAVVVQEGFTQELLAKAVAIKERRGRLRQFAEENSDAGECTIGLVTWAKPVLCTKHGLAFALLRAVGR